MESKIKHEDLKCEFCDGTGEREINVDGADCPQECSFCNGTGIDEDQLKKAFKDQWLKWTIPTNSF